MFDKAFAVACFCLFSFSLPYNFQCLMYKKLMDSQHRKSLVNEILIYHMQVGVWNGLYIDHSFLFHICMFCLNFALFSPNLYFYHVWWHEPPVRILFGFSISIFRIFFISIWPTYNPKTWFMFTMKALVWP